MPGSKRVLTDSFIERRMHDNDLTEDQLFGYREDELPHIQAGTVMLIPEVEKERVLDLLQETLRLRIELGSLVSGIRGDPYLRSMSARGEDFLYVSVQPVQHLSTSPIAYLLQRLSKHLESKYSIDIPPAELHFEITGGERIPNGYTLLDLVFVAATSAYRNDHFADTYKILRITLDLRPMLVPLGPLVRTSCRTRFDCEHLSAFVLTGCRKIQRKCQLFLKVSEIQTRKGKVT